MKTIHEIFIQKQSFPLDLFTYPCVDPNVYFFTGRNITFCQKGHTLLGEKVREKCKNKGAAVYDVVNKDTDILIVNSPFLKNEKPGNDENAYYDVLFHYIKPVQQVIPFMLEKKHGQIVFILPPSALTPSTNYAMTAAYASAGLVKGLALKYASLGITVNGLVLGESEDFDIIAEWVVFLASGNARNIMGGLVEFSGF
jgi:hypothetical protein